MSSQSKKLKVYMAGPDVFLPNALEIAEQKKVILDSAGFEGIYPLDNSIENADSLKPEELARCIYVANIEMIQACDIVLANLTPFRGPSADAGTVFEIGYGYALDKDIYAYSNVTEDFKARIEAYNNEPIVTRDDGHLADKDGMSVENFGLIDNLMIDFPCRDMLEGRQITTEATTKVERYTSLKAFSAQVARMQRAYDTK